MKKVVQGILCNTKTANRIGGYEYSSGGDFAHYEEALYRTKSGMYFLHGTGGAASKYSRMTGQNEWSGGEAIKLMPPEAARQWAKDHLDAAEYIAAFGEPEEMASVLIADEAKAKLVKLKRKTGKDIDQLIAEAVDRYEP